MNAQAHRLYDYHVWANNKVFAHLNAQEEGLLTRQVTSVFSSIAEVLTHIYTADITWLNVMQGKNFNEIVEIKTEKSKQVAGAPLAVYQEAYQEIAQNFRQFFAANDLSRPIEIEHRRFGKLVCPLEDLVFHVANHGTYHRGNITAMLRQLGLTGVPTDYVFFKYL
ncbi:DinB family protein [Shouchella clausii]|uniref:Damage-inducible protein DinB n=1 Tax=Shouchella clausii TaxID=79880 RepID=A0A268NZJ3_SHOCL|nr:DinB family protein [Shouchella clausii]MCZ1183932.1 DUF664 domain-containing protein [Shouchella clausii]PAD17506.1 hypothetical protein CHH73_09180 [Shouchella clausii]PAD47363.1 hypothetical protein CHI09_07425 [Shouchella clausii]PAE88913.1 hypothetical protein CHH72_11100 [Shouchella clausii]PAF09996.1 hypothetical protein CHH65_08325 [Shouchella clausii]